MSDGDQSPAQLVPIKTDDQLLHEGGTAIIEYIIPDGVTSIACVRVPQLDMELELYIDTKSEAEMVADIKQCLCSIWAQLVEQHRAHAVAQH